MRQDELVDIEAVSDELYGLPLDEFIAARTEREKQAKAGGDKDLAAQIHQLAKPNLVAWLANQLAREHADEIGPLLHLGAALREATAILSGQQLRELSRQQRQVVYALVQQARRIASAAGRKVSGDTERALEDTLRAALADPNAGDSLAAGRLTEGMQNTGFGDASGRHDRPGRPVRETEAAVIPPTKGIQTALERKRAERAKQVVTQAKSAADKAAAARQKSKDGLEFANLTAVDLDARIERLRQDLEEAMKAQSKTENDQQRAQAAFDRAERGAQDAQQRLADATKAYDRLTHLT